MIGFSPKDAWHLWHLMAFVETPKSLLAIVIRSKLQPHSFCGGSELLWNHHSAILSAPNRAIDLAWLIDIQVVWAVSSMHFQYPKTLQVVVTSTSMFVWGPGVHGDSRDIRGATLVYTLNAGSQPPAPKHEARKASLKVERTSLTAGYWPKLPQYIS